MYMHANNNMAADTEQDISWHQGKMAEKSCIIIYCCEISGSMLDLSLRYLP